MRRATFLLTVLGTLTAIAWGVFGLSAWIGQNEATAIWDQESAARSQNTGPEFFRLSFPAENTAFIVRDGASDANLLLGPAFVDWSSLPGDNGNSIITGHRDTHFRILRNVRKGDPITVERAGEMFKYRVVELRIVPGEDIKYYQSTGKPTLTLTTDYPFSYVGPAPKRYIVRAELLSNN